MILYTSMSENLIDTLLAGYSAKRVLGMVHGFRCICFKILINLGYRLLDVVHSEKRLYLVFEYLDLDLKKFMDSSPEFTKDLRQIKVSELFLALGGW